MSDTKHTPEKWIVGYGQGLTGPTTPNSHEGPFCRDSWPFEVVSFGTQTVAILPARDIGEKYPHNKPEDLSETRNRARLLAAAPALLEALAPFNEWNFAGSIYETLPEDTAVLFDHRSGRRITIADFHRVTSALATSRA